jgi:hypothetical protein
MTLRRKWSEFQRGQPPDCTIDSVQRDLRCDRATAEQQWAGIMTTEYWLNHLYQVNKYEVLIRADGKLTHPEGWPPVMVWLSIKRRDKGVIKDWRDMQRIKNELCDPECEGVELYPAESRLVDESNQYHIFVAPKGYRFPFGYDYRSVFAGRSPGINARQRPIREQRHG